jgi:uncharacterized membrane protein required for colicin V production
MPFWTRFNWVDVLIIIIMLRISYVAFQDGLSHEIFPLLGTAFTVVFSLHYYHKFALFLSQNASGPAITLLDFVSFIIIAVGASFLFRIIKAVLDKMINVTWHPLIEKAGGLLAGIARAGLIASVVLIILSLVPLPYLQRSIRDRSYAGVYFLSIGPVVYEKVLSVMPGKGDRGSVNAKKLTGRLISDKTIGQKKAGSKGDVPEELLQ